MKKFRVQAINLEQKKCHQDFAVVIDVAFDEDKDFYIFKNKNYFFRIRRINDHDYRLRVIRRVKYRDILFHQLKSLEEVKNTILQYF